MDVKKLQLIKANLERDRLEMLALDDAGVLDGDDDNDSDISATFLMRMSREMSNLVTALLEDQS